MLRCLWGWLWLWQWIGLRVKMLSVAVIMLSCVIALVSHSLPDSFMGAYPALLALAVSNATSLSKNLQWMVRVTTKTEAEMSRVERMHHYSNVEPEAPLDAGRSARYAHVWLWLCGCVAVAVAVWLCGCGCGCVAVWLWPCGCGCVAV